MSGLEIERKFLVTSDAWRTTDGVQITQGYLARGSGQSVRVRVTPKKAWLSVKGPRHGIVCEEFEYPIPVDDGQKMLALCGDLVIEKIRHTVDHKGMRWEIDEFLGKNQGLVVAEIELSEPEQPFEHPAWLGREVTADPRYLNANLATQPIPAHDTYSHT